MPPVQFAPEVAGYTSSNGHWQLLGGREAHAMMLQQSCTRTQNPQNLCFKWNSNGFLEASCLQHIKNYQLINLQQLQRCFRPQILRWDPTEEEKKVTTSSVYVVLLPVCWAIRGHTEIAVARYGDPPLPLLLWSIRLHSNRPWWCAPWQKLPETDKLTAASCRGSRNALWDPLHVH